MLQALGVDAALAAVVLGDLAEEYALRVARDGVAAARWWYVSEALRSAPHLVKSVVVRGGPRERARLTAWLGGGVLTLGTVALALALRDGPPIRLVPAAASSTAGGVVVNSLRPVTLPMRVLDRRGHELDTAGIRFRWVSGVPVAVAPNGVILCKRRGDAVVAASLGSVSADVRVLCRPVDAMGAAEQELSVVLGTAPRALSFWAVDRDGQPVTALTGVLRLRDTSVATLIGTPGGQRVSARAPGRTIVDATVGDIYTSVGVVVYAPVPTLDGLRPEQQFVAAPVRLERGESRRWRLAPGYYSLAALPSEAGAAAPKLEVLGANCLGGGETQRFVCVAGPNASLVASHPWQDASTAPRTGYIAVEQIRY
jgi:hypothetical protein